MREKLREKYGDILRVFGFNDESLNRLYSAIEKPPVPEAFRGLLTPENGYRYVLDEDVNRLMFEAHQSVPQHRLLSNGYIEQFLGLFSKIKSEKLMNYKVVISKNFDDFLLCSSTSGNLTSCYSLFSTYEGSAWSGIPTSYMYQNRVLVMVVNLDEKVTKFGLESYRMKARAWAFRLPADENIYISKVYGDQELFMNKTLMVSDVHIRDIVPVYDLSLCVPVQEEVPVLYDKSNRAMFPYFDLENINRDFDDRYVLSELCQRTASCGAFMPYDNGTSFSELYMDYPGTSIGEYNDNECEDDDDRYECELCHELYYEDDLYYTCVDGSYMYVCDSCMEDLYRVNGNYYTRNYAVNLLYSIVENQDLGYGLYDADYTSEENVLVDGTQVRTKFESTYEALVYLQHKKIYVPEIKMRYDYASVYHFEPSSLSLYVLREEKEELLRYVDMPEEQKKANVYDDNVFFVEDEWGHIHKFYVLQDGLIAYENTLMSTDIYCEPLVQLAWVLSVLRGVKINDILDLGYDESVLALFYVPEEYYRSYVQYERDADIGIAKSIVRREERDGVPFVRYTIWTKPRGI